VRRSRWILITVPIVAIGVVLLGLKRWWAAPDLTGVVMRAQSPQVGIQLRLAVPPNQSPLCEVDDRSGVTDGHGEFALAGIRSTEWTFNTYRRHVSWTLCAATGADSVSGAWRMIYAYSGSPLHRLRLRCDLNVTDGDACVEEDKEF
jgi:hypothetical protein